MKFLSAISGLLWFLFAPLIAQTAAELTHETDALESADGALFASLINPTAERLAKRHSMEPLWILGSTGEDQKIQTVDLYFQLQKPLVRNELRRIIVDCVRETVSAFNTSSQLASWLATGSLSESDVSINLYLFDADGHFASHPAIAIVEARDGDLLFRTIGRRGWFGQAREFDAREPYSVAREIVRVTTPLPQAS